MVLSIGDASTISQGFNRFQFFVREFHAFSA
jgi:hypothetical protein